MIIIEGVVVAGRRLGRTLGFPTANVEICGGEEIKSGVYLSRIEVEDMWHWGVTNVGTNPTVGEVKRRAESYIFDFNGDIYGRTIRVELREFLRGEIRFDSVNDLRRQILSDADKAREILKTLKFSNLK